MPGWYAKPAKAGFAYQKVVETTFSQVADCARWLQSLTKRN
jgi:hypothetical protein